MVYGSFNSGNQTIAIFSFYLFVLLQSREYWMISPNFPAASCLSFSVFLCVAGRTCWRERGEGVRVGEEPNYTTARKSDPV